jgi:peptide/nickel transport system permease protein
MALLLVSHDWGVIADVCDRVVVIYAGQVVERADVGHIFDEPLHPYTEALLRSNPTNQPTGILPVIPGTVPEPGAWPTGCHFGPRCGSATPESHRHEILVGHLPGGRETRCVHYEQLLASAKRASST